MKILREPLLHFLLLGTGLFLLFHLVNRSEPDTAGEIVVTSGTIEHLATTFARTWQRAPTQAELDGLIDDYIREEVFYREATALGLDRDDTIIRRRLRQKMEFIADDVVALAEPDDSELRSFFQRHVESYRQPSRYSFRHVYLDPMRHGDNLSGEIARLSALLNDGGAADVEELGDRLMLPSRLESVSRADVAATFGEELAQQLQQLPLKRWEGPVPSAYGVHLVFLEERVEGEVPDYDEVRDEVRRDWEYDKRKEAIEKLFKDRLQRYTVRIEASQAENYAQVHE